MTPTLNTSRLILRAIEMDDAPAAQALFAHWDVVKYLDANRVPWPYPDHGMVDFYTNSLLPKMAANETVAWAVTLKSGGTFIGSIQIGLNDESDSRGFWLGLPYQGHGYMSEVVTATTDYVFDVLQRPMLRLTNAVPNRASSNIKTKQGARLVEIKQGNFVSGPADKEIWELTPDDWRASPLKKKFS